MPEDKASNAVLTATQHARVRRFALMCSGTCRLGKFKRVSPSFIAAADASVEKLRREIASRYTANHFSDILDVNDNSIATPVFLTKHERDAIIREIEFMIGRLVQRKVEQHPSCGKTLT